MERRCLVGSGLIVELGEVQSAGLLDWLVGLSLWLGGLGGFFGGELRVTLGLLAGCFGLLGFLCFSVVFSNLSVCVAKGQSISEGLKNFFPPFPGKTTDRKKKSKHSLLSRALRTLRPLLILLSGTLRVFYRFLSSCCFRFLFQVHTR
jgi:hypothetical protein